MRKVSVRAPGVGVIRLKASNALYRTIGRRLHGTRQRISNARNRRTLERGRAPRISAVNAAVSSRMPVYRNRINPATGRKHRDDATMHRTRNKGLAAVKASRDREALAGVAARTRAHAAIVAMRNNALDPADPRLRAARERAGGDRLRADRRMASVPARITAVTRARTARGSR